MTKLIIDADTGSDDAVAILMAYQNLSEKDILGVTVVSGNVPLDQGLLNTIFVNELCDVNVPIYKGANKPLERDYVEVYKTEEATKTILLLLNMSMELMGLGILVLNLKETILKKKQHKNFIQWY
jgi:inosine-uridine nucleoside N-ribohydrolase